MRTTHWAMPSGQRPGLDPFLGATGDSGAGTCPDSVHRQSRPDCYEVRRVLSVNCAADRRYSPGATLW